MVGGLEAGVMLVLALASARIFVRRKDRDAAVVSLIALAMIPISLWRSHYPLITVPLIWAFVLVMVVMVRRAR